MDRFIRDDQSEAIANDLAVILSRSFGQSFIREHLCEVIYAIYDYASDRILAASISKACGLSYIYVHNEIPGAISSLNVDKNMVANIHWRLTELGLNEWMAKYP